MGDLQPLLDPVTTGGNGNTTGGVLEPLLDLSQWETMESQQGLS